MRKESSNQFTEGLVCDLNPINTPNTVLTDALNATLITYDGNEFSLQNDRGNYPLENCKLKPNYIPVGLKEYGDILYIVSYNPLDNHVEIGTYPSPANIITSKGATSDLKIQSVIEEIKESANYSELIEKCKTHIWMSENPEDSKLYPGDEYKLKEVDKSPYKYEALEYFIVDENRVPHPINDLVKVDNQFHPVAWQWPGWLAAQYRIGSFADFTMSVRSAEWPEVEGQPLNCKFNLNFQFKIDDYLFLPSYNKDIKSDLSINLKINKNGTEIDNLHVPLSTSEFLEWYSDSKILWLDYSINLNDIEFNDEITIIAYPVITIETGVTRKIIYDNPERRTFNIKSKGDVNDFTFGNTLWKFYIDSDDPEDLYIEYNVEGPTLTNNSVQLYYRIRSLDKETIKDWALVDNYSGVTEQGIGILKFENGFEPEAIYIIDFLFHSPGEIESNIHPSCSKLVIASQIFADFIGDYDDFSKIGFDKWTSKFKDTLRSDWDVQFTIDTLNTNNVIKNVLWNSSGKFIYSNASNVFSGKFDNLWDLSYRNSDKGFVTDKNINNEVKILRGFNGTIDLDLKSKTTALKGKLWNNTPKLEVYLKKNDQTSEVLAEVGRDSISSNLEFKCKVDAICGKQKTFNHDIIGETTFTSGIRNIEKMPLMWLYSYPRRKGLSNEQIDSSFRYGSFIENKNNTLSFPDKSYTKEINLLVSRSDATIPNDISKAIVQSMDGYDIGLFGFCYDLRDADPEGQLYPILFPRLYHGSDYEVIGKKDTGNQVVCIYLVIKDSDNPNSAILIPMNDKDGSFWKWKLGDGLGNNSAIKDWSHVDLDIMREQLSQILKNFIENMFICDDSEAIQKGYFIKITGTTEWEPIPLGSIDIKTKSFSEWLYESKNLLNSNDRSSIINSIGSDVCGNLLTGTTYSISEISFGSVNIESIWNDTSINSELLEVDKTVSQLNETVKMPELQNNNLLDLLRGKSNTKGVYWIGGTVDYNKLIEKLNLIYSNSNNTTLTAEGLSTTYAYVQVGNDKDKLYIGSVTKDLKVNMDTK